MMEEGSAAGGAGGESELGNAAATSFVSGGGGRQRFEVELRPGETTIVSWKKLVKDANRAKVPPPPVPAAELSAIAAAPPPLPVSNVVPPPPGQMAGDEANDAPPASRFSAVIEKIERLYMGKNSSDEEDLNDIPDDDEYDTEDSFIDDAELDEYFQVDNSAVKHDGFFVNRGKLERTEPTLVPSGQPKKRRRKDLAKSNGGSDDRHISNKQIKVNRKAAGGLVPSVDKNSTSPSHFIPTPTVRTEDVKHQIQVSTSEACSSKKSADAKTSGEPSPSRGSNGEDIIMAKYNDKQKSGIVQSKNHDSKMKDGTDAIAASSLRTSDKSSVMQPKSQSGLLPNNVEDLSQSVQRKEKNIIRERSDIKVPENSLQTVVIAIHKKNPLIARKEGSNVKSKSTMLEKAIRELEKIVAESRPPSMDIPDADMSSQAIKRRMPPEIKQKLAKVARLAQTSNGKISKELLNRLMSIVGHLIQLRTLKRNLKIMVNTGVSAIEEKDSRLWQLKKEVDEMVKMRVPLMKSKAIEQQAGASDDFQEASMKEKEGIKKRCSMDDALEDKICDIYDVFVDGLDEDAAPQVRKLYAELAELWPKGFMDNHGIKYAICRSKERKKSQYNRHKDQEKMKRKKLLTQNTEGTIQVEVGSSAQQQYIPERLVNIDSANNGSSSVNRPVPNTALVANAATKMSVPSVNGPNIDRPKQEKVKAISNNPVDDKMTEVPIKKKVKRKPEARLGEAAHTRTDKLAPAQGGEKRKSSKPATTSVQKIPQPVTIAPPTHPPHLNTSANLL